MDRGAGADREHRVSGANELRLDELERNPAPFDEAVRSTDSIDAFCSGTSWILPAVHHLHAPTEVVLRESSGCFLALARSSSQSGASVLHPLESMWALASPLVGPDHEVLVELLAETLARSRGWDVCFVAGLTADSPLLSKLVAKLARSHRLAPGPSTRRYVADLSRGVDGFLGRRSKGFRANLRKASRRAERDGVRFEVADAESPSSPDESFDRLLDVERRSWKGRAGVGIDHEPMRGFYREMNRRLLASSSRRLSFARIGDEDVAYIFGGRAGATYRGLQFSFDDSYASLSLGNLCQLAEIRRAVGDGMTRYDLGTEVGYKRRWGDFVFSTSSLFVYS